MRGEASQGQRNATRHAPAPREVRGVVWLMLVLHSMRAAESSSRLDQASCIYKSSLGLFHRFVPWCCMRYRQCQQHKGDDADHVTSAVTEVPYDTRTSPASGSSFASPMKQVWRPQTSYPPSSRATRTKPSFFANVA